MRRSRQADRYVYHLVNKLCILLVRELNAILPTFWQQTNFDLRHVTMQIYKWYTEQRRYNYTLQHANQQVFTDYTSKWFYHKERFYNTEGSYHREGFHRREGFYHKQGFYQR